MKHQKTKRRGAEAMYTPIVRFETKSELDNYLKENKEWGYSFTNKGYYGKKAYYHCKQSNYWASSNYKMLAFKPVNNFQDYYFTNDKEKPITAQYVEITR